MDVCYCFVLGPAKGLFERPFYEQLSSSLKPGGIMCNQGQAVMSYGEPLHLAPFVAVATTPHWKELLRKNSLCTHISSLEGVMELKFAPFSSS